MPEANVPAVEQHVSESPDESSGAEQGAAARPFWSGTISFGLVSIPVNLYPANRSSHMGLRLLGPKGTPLRRRYFSSKNDRELQPEEMVRGYEVGEGRYVEITDEELERLAPEKSRDIDLRRFVRKNAISPLYFERAYFLAPAASADKAYQLLAAVMEKTNRIGLATFVMRGKEYVIALLSENGILRAETLRFADEIRSPSELGLPKKTKTDAQQVRRFEKAINAATKSELSEKELRDETSERLLQIVNAKKRRAENVVTVSPEKSGEGEVINILDVLKRSLASRNVAGGVAARSPVSRKTRASGRRRPDHARRAA